VDAPSPLRATIHASPAVDDSAALTWSACARGASVRLQPFATSIQARDAVHQAIRDRRGGVVLAMVLPVSVRARRVYGTHDAWRVREPSASMRSAAEMTLADSCRAAREPAALPLPASNTAGLGVPRSNPI